MKNTIAQDCHFAFVNGLALQAYEHAVDSAVSLRSAVNHDIARFTDGSEVRLYIDDDHEITIIEV